MGGPILVSNSPRQTVPASVAEFGSGANGNVSPTRTIGGPNQSPLVSASGVTQDADGFVYVAAPVIKTIHVYRAGASGDVEPFAILGGTNPGLANPQGIAIADGKLYVANGPFGPGWTGPPSVAVFALPLAAGVNDVDPVGVISGPATGLDSPFGLALDAAGHIYVANLNNTVTVHSAPTTSSYAAPDNAAPILTISAGLVGPEGLAIRGDTLYVSNDNNTITQYSLPSGAPGAIISGPDTGLDEPLGISVDSSGNIFVVNTANKVIEFAVGASGNAAPIARIFGAATGLDAPQFVFTPA